MKALCFDHNDYYALPQMGRDMIDEWLHHHFHQPIEVRAIYLVNEGGTVLICRLALPKPTYQKPWAYVSFTPISHRLPEWVLERSHLEPHPEEWCEYYDLPRTVCA